VWSDEVKIPEIGELTPEPPPEKNALTSGAATLGKTTHHGTPTAQHFPSLPTLRA